MGKSGTSKWIGRLEPMLNIKNFIFDNPKSRSFVRLRNQSVCNEILRRRSQSSAQLELLLHDYCCCLNLLNLGLASFRFHLVFVLVLVSAWIEGDNFAICKLQIPSNFALL